MLGAAVGGPIRAHGLTMDRTMAALVRFVRRMENQPRPSLRQLRTLYAEAPKLTGLAPDRSVGVRELMAGGCAARLYEPPGLPPGASTMLWFHGGGFIVGSVATHDALCRRLAARARVRVLGADYRLAPEHKFPAAHDDAASVLAWARANLPGPLLLGGDSAGGNLAAGLAQDGGVRLQVLLYPVVDMVHIEGTYPSLDQFADGYLLTAQGMVECGRLLMPEGQDRADPRLSPLRADLSHAAPALIMTAGFDPLRDQGAAYAAAMRTSGRPATLLEEPLLVHGFADFAGVVPEARRAVDRLAAAIRAAL